MGLYFPEARWRDLERGVVAAAAANGFASTDAYCQSLLARSLSRAQIETLSVHLTIGETYFFREKPTFRALRETILPDLIRTRRDSLQQLRVWSAGCCTGEEAYSCAILLNQLLPARAEWSVSILATDINPNFIEKAVAGVYGKWSFRDVAPTLQDRYFRPTADGRFEIVPSIKQQVKFSLLNLAEDSFPLPSTRTLGLDLILCRNVLMYFSSEQAKRVVRRFYDALVDGGWLIVSLGEVSSQLYRDFDAVQFPNAILYQKRRHRQAASPDQVDAGAFAGRTLAAGPFDAASPKWWRSDERPWGRPWGRTWDSALEKEWAKVARMEMPRVGPVPVANPLPPTEAASQPTPTVRQSQLLFEQGRDADAEAQALSEVAAKPDDTAALLQLARICANQGRLDEALAWCVRALATDNLDPHSHYLHATIQQARGEFDAAAQSLQCVIYLYPEFIMAHFALGCLAQRKDKTREAEKHFANLLALVRQTPPQEVLPDSDGLTAGRLVEMVQRIAVNSPIMGTSASGASKFGEAASRRGVA